MNPYKLNVKAIRDYMQYQDIPRLGDVAEKMRISKAYLSQLLADQRQLNEAIRLRFQIVTNLSQEKLFIPQFEALPTSHQTFNMLKYYGVIPYEKNSATKEFREGDTEILPDHSWKKIDMNAPIDGRQKHFKKSFFKQ